MKSLLFWRLNYSLTFCSRNLLFISQIFYELTIFCANPQFFCQINMYILFFSRIHQIFCEFTLNSLSDTQIHYGSILFFVNSLWFQYQIRELTVNSLSSKRIHYGLIIFFANPLWIIMISLQFSITIYFLSVTRIWIRNKSAKKKVISLNRWLLHEKDNGSVKNSKIVISEKR